MRIEHRETRPGNETITLSIPHTDITLETYEKHDPYPLRVIDFSSAQSDLHRQITRIPPSETTPGNCYQGLAKRYNIWILAFIFSMHRQKR